MNLGASPPPHFCTYTKGPQVATFLPSRGSPTLHGHFKITDSKRMRLVLQNAMGLRRVGALSETGVATPPFDLLRPSLL